MEPSGATRAPVWQSDRNAYSAMGGKGEVELVPVTGASSAEPLQDVVADA